MQPGKSANQNEELINYYKLLGLENFEKDPNKIKKAYKINAREKHPDKNPELNTTKDFIMIGRAFEILSDPFKKANYDLQLRPQLLANASAADKKGMDFNTNYNIKVNNSIDLHAISTDYEKEFPSKPKINREQPIFEFENKDKASHFFKNQHDKNRAFDVYCKELDHRIYSDGKGTFFEGTQSEYDNFMKKHSNQTPAIESQTPMIESEASNEDEDFEPRVGMGM